MQTIELISVKVAVPGPKKSAEARALERIKDIDDPSQWITVVEIDDPIDENALEAWLDKKEKTLIR